MPRYKFGDCAFEGAGPSSSFQSLMHMSLRPNTVAALTAPVTAGRAPPARPSSATAPRRSTYLAESGPIFRERRNWLCRRHRRSAHARHGGGFAKVPRHYKVRDYVRLEMHSRPSIPAESVVACALRPSSPDDNRSTSLVPFSSAPATSRCEGPLACSETGSNP